MGVGRDIPGTLNYGWARLALQRPQRREMAELVAFLQSATAQDNCLILSNGLSQGHFSRHYQTSLFTGMNRIAFSGRYLTFIGAETDLNPNKLLHFKGHIERFSSTCLGKLEHFYGY
jgi:hypothetical protein